MYESVQSGRHECGRPGRDVYGARVVLSMVGFYVPGISLLALLSLPLPIAYMGIREGVKWAVIATSGIMILDSAFFGITTAFFWW